MPSSEVLKKGKAGKLHSGGPSGPVVTHGSAQEKAIFMSEKRNEEETGSPDRTKRSKPSRKKR